MKKKAIAALLTSAMVLGTLAMAGCGGTEAGAEKDTNAQGTEGEAPKESTGEASGSMTGKITVISREDGSGTRGAFVELFGVEEKNDAGEKIDMTTLDAEITNNTSVMMTTVAGNPSAVGYISLGSLNDTIKGVKIDGVEASADNVKSGTYKIARPFNIVSKDDVSDVAKDFVDYIMSSEGQAVVEESGYIAVDDAAAAYAGSAPEGKIVVAGSSSVTPVMEKLKEAYALKNPNASIEIQQSDSTTGVNSTLEGICDIGMVSRELKDSETGVNATVIAQDGIAVIVNKENGTDELTSDQVKAIYTGETTKWDEIK